MNVMEREKMSRVLREFKKVLEGALWGREFNARERKSKALFFRKLKLKRLFNFLKKRALDFLSLTMNVML